MNVPHVFTHTHSHIRELTLSGLGILLTITHKETGETESAKSFHLLSHLLAVLLGFEESSQNLQNDFKTSRYKLKKNFIYWKTTRTP